MLRETRLSVSFIFDRGHGIWSVSPLIEVGTIAQLLELELRVLEMWAVSGEIWWEWLMLQLFHKSVLAVPFIFDQFHSLGIICQEPADFLFTGRGKCSLEAISIYATTTASLLFALHFTIEFIWRLNRITWYVKSCGALWCLSSEITLQVWAGFTSGR